MTAAAERRYRRALWAYPGSYRRRHGTEIVTTLLEMAEDGHTRPRAGQTLHLIACGLRQRFRLPAGRPLAWVAAILTAVALGAAGAAGGTWLGWRTAAAVPTESQARALADAMSGGSGAAIYPYETAMAGPAVGAVTHGTSTWSADRIRAALTADGWQVTEFAERSGGLVVDVGAEPWTTVPTQGAIFWAGKDGLRLEGDSDVVVGGARHGIDGQLTQRLDVWALDPGTVRPLGIAGGLAGLVAGWLIAASVAYRIRRAPRPARVVATVLAGAGLAGVSVPAFHLYRGLYQVMVYDTHNPTPYIVYGPMGDTAAILLRAGSAVALLAFAGLAVVVVLGARKGAVVDQPPQPA